MKKYRTVKLTVSALSLAAALILPFLTAYIPKIGNMLSPMHIPVFICGFVCGWEWGAAVGFIAPLLRSLLFGMPVIFPLAVSMAPELATYGLLAGLLYKIFPKKVPYIYLTLIISMICGRLVEGAARYVCAGISGTEFPLSAFISGTVTTSLPGIILHILIIPPIIIALKRAGIVRNN